MKDIIEQLTKDYQQLSPSFHPLSRQLQKRILILDGAMGTMIQRHELDETDFKGEIFKNHSLPLKGNNDLLSLTRPDIILDIHKQYFKAGADIVETNTFSGTAIAQADYELEHIIYDLNFKSAQLAKEAALEYSTVDQPRFVAGSIGPTNRTASISPDVNNPGFRAVSFDELKIAYKEQIQALIEGGVDILLIETVFDTLNAKAALMACHEFFEDIGMAYPIMISGTITDASGRTLSGQTTEAFSISLSHIPLLSIGLNCALGADQLQQYMKILDEVTPFYTSAHPNAGLPNEFGQYDETPLIMRKKIEDYLENNLVNIIGGCCGTTPEHIKEIADLASNYSPRQRKIK